MKTLTEVHQPDNIETTPERVPPDRGPRLEPAVPGRLDDPDRDDGAALARAVRRDAAQVVAKVDQSADGGPTDVDGRAAGNQGAWESTGIVDASAAFGRGTFLINIQAHTLWIEKAPGDDNNGDGQPDFTYKREGGQLLMIRAPGL